MVTMRKVLRPLHQKALPGILGVFFFLLVVQLNGQNIASNAITGTNPNLDNPYTAGQLLNDSVTFLGIGRSSGIIGNAANDRYNAREWVSDELDTDKYFSFIIEPEPNYHIEFESFEYSGQRSDVEGPREVSFRSSHDGFSNNLWTATIEGTTIDASIDLSGEDFQGITGTIEFRIYAWGATDETGTFSINSFSFKGYVFDTNCLTPSAPKTITGPALVNSWQKGVAYEVAEVNRADEDGYVWSLPPGASIATGEGTRSITVDFADISGNISVYGTNSCGAGPSSPVRAVAVEYPVIYLHDFNSGTISLDPSYDEVPPTFADNLSNSSWTNTAGSWTSSKGVLELPDSAITASNLTATPSSFNLNFDIEPGYQLKVTHFNFWRQRSETGPTSWNMSINETGVGSDNILTTTGTFIGKRAVLNEINSIAGTVSIELLLGGATNASGTLRIDDFTLYGMVDCIPVVADSPDDVFVCGSYTLPPLPSGNYYYTGSSKSGVQLFENDEITSTQTIYVYIENEDAPECFDENSFEVTIYEEIETNTITRSE
jgi:hypothetical protein